MPAQLRVLRRRIRTVQSTKKITRAMELIAASRIIKAQGRVDAAPASLAWKIGPSSARPHDPPSAGVSRKPVEDHFSTER